MKPGFEGQSIIEVLVAVAVGTALVIAAAGLIAPTIKINLQTSKVQVGAALASELMNNIRVTSEGNWHTIGNLATSSANHYYLNTSVSPFQVVAGDETVIAGSSTFVRYFYVDDVYRDGSGNITVSGGSYDPSTKKVTVGYTFVNTNGTLDVGWATGTPSPSNTGWDPAFAYGGNIYVLSFSQQAVYFATLSSTGTIGGTWNNTTTPPQVISGDAAQYGGYVYAASLGTSGGISTSSIYYGKLDSTKGVTSWSTAPPLPGPEQGGAVVTANGNLYVVGGTTSTIFYAPINLANGSLGSWKVAGTTTSTPEATLAGDIIAYGGYLYQVGATVIPTPLVYDAPINADGTIGAWAQATSFPVSIRHAGLAAYGGYLYAIDGLKQSGIQQTTTPTVYSTPVGSSGTLGAWQSVTSLSAALWGSRPFMQNSIMYNVGGFTTNNSSTPTPNIGYNTVLNVRTAVVNSSFSGYLSRNANFTYDQTDWSGGPGKNGPATTTNAFFSTSTGIAYASTTGSIALSFSTASVTSSYVQSISSVVANLASTSAAFASSTASGDAIVVAASWRGNTSAVASVADTLGSSFTNVLGPVASADGQTVGEIWYAAGINAGSDSVTALLSGSAPSLTLDAFEYSHFTSSALDTAAWSTSSSAKFLDSGYASTSASNELIFGFGLTSSTPWAAGSGFTSRLTTSTSMAEDGLVFRAGSYDTTMAQTASTSWLMMMAAFKLTGTGNSTNTPNISPGATSHWAWNDAIGWIDFYSTGSVIVKSSGLNGYASSSVGDASLDCATARGGSVCNGTNNYQVTNDGNGYLSGWAWNDAVGWIALFWGNSTSNGLAPTSTYNAACTGYAYYCGVYIDASGNFQGSAWNDAIGWIYFNCDSPGSPGCGVTYYVQTTWSVGGAAGTLDSTTYDTGIASGSQLNAVLWQGTLPAGGTTEFQFAGSNSSSGPWNFAGPSGDQTTWYVASPGVSVPLSYTLFNNYRYFRYRVNLIQGAGVGASSSPTVNDVIINWSP